MQISFCLFSSFLICLIVFLFEFFFFFSPLFDAHINQINLFFSTTSLSLPSTQVYPIFPSLLLATFRYSTRAPSPYFFLYTFFPCISPFLPLFFFSQTYAASSVFFFFPFLYLVKYNYLLECLPTSASLLMVFSLHMYTFLAVFLSNLPHLPPAPYS